MSFLFCYIKIHGYLLPTNDSVTSHITHLENADSLNHADLPNVNIIHHTNHWLVSPPISSEEGKY